MKCRSGNLNAHLYRDPRTGMFTATLTTPCEGRDRVLIGAYGTNDAIMAFKAFARFERQTLLSAVAGPSYDRSGLWIRAGRARPSS
jgi:hypothetical protein